MRAFVKSGSGKIHVGADALVRPVERSSTAFFFAARYSGCPILALFARVGTDAAESVKFGLGFFVR